MRRADLVHEQRQRAVHYPPPHAAHYAVVPGAPPEQVNVSGMTATLMAAGNAIDMADWSAHEMLSNRVWAYREAVASARIEGETGTVTQALAYWESNGREVLSDDVTERHSVAGMVRIATALNSLAPGLRKNGAQALTLDAIKALHRMIVAGDLDYRGLPGRWRERVAWIGPAGRGIEHSNWNPPPPRNIAACMAEHAAYLTAPVEPPGRLALPARMAVAHAHFESVHPFDDYNGRMGRLLMALMMAAGNHRPVYLSDHLQRHRAAYYAALSAASMRLDYGPIIALVSEAIVAGAGDVARVNREVDALVDGWRGNLPSRRGSAAIRMLDHLPAYPVLNVNRAVSLLGVAYSAAKRGIDQLVQAGVLRPVGTGRRNRLYRAPAILDLIEAGGTHTKGH